MQELNDSLPDQRTGRPIRREIRFSIDGQPFTTVNPNMRAASMLKLAGLDPTVFDLGEVFGRGRPMKKRFADDELVSITMNARFVSIRQSATVA